MHRWAELRRPLHEDSGLLVLDKPAGISVTGERHDVDLVRLAADAGERLYPVHRIDKVTSGVLLLARDLAAHGALTRQFQQRTAEKTYLAITATTGLPARGEVELPLSVGRKNRVRVAAERDAIECDGTRWSVPDDAVFRHVRSYPSRTTFERLWADEHGTVLAVHPETGRRHQIRVHLAWIGHALAGDPLFDRQATGRTALHAWRLAVDWPAGTRVHFEAEPGDDFWAPLAARVPSPLRRLMDAYGGLKGADHRHMRP